MSCGSSRDGIISIHAPREGCDHGCTADGQAKKISIHAPREGCDAVVAPMRWYGFRFQSTHPARGATSRRHPQSGAIPISIHAPREGCDRQVRGFTTTAIRISIHAPREGCDVQILSAFFIGLKFQSTHPARGATANFTKEQRVCLAQFAYLHKGKKAEHTKTNAPMLHEAFLYAFWVRTGRRRRVLLDFARYKIKGSSGR